MVKQLRSGPGGRDMRSMGELISSGYRRFRPGVLRLRAHHSHRGAGTATIPVHKCLYEYTLSKPKSRPTPPGARTPKATLVSGIKLKIGSWRQRKAKGNRGHFPRTDFGRTMET